jgi:hypothetical protein
MPGYVKKALAIFQHKQKYKQDQPFNTHPYIWGTETICQETFFLAQTGQARGEVHSKSVWKILILWLCC